MRFSNINLSSVKSSNVEAIGCDPEKKDLHVKFKEVVYIVDLTIRDLFNRIDDLGFIMIDDKTPFRLEPNLKYFVYFVKVENACKDDPKRLSECFVEWLTIAKEKGVEGIRWKERPEINLYSEFNCDQLHMNIYAKLALFPNVEMPTVEKFPDSSPGPNIQTPNFLSS